MTTQTPTGLGLRQPSGVLSSRAAGVKRVVHGGGGNIAGDGTLPRISPLLLRWFTWYSRRYLRRHFHSLQISCAGLPPDVRGLPLVVYSNHASWWDALVCLVLKDEFFPERNAFTPIDAAMLERYGFFRKLGFFGVEQRSRRGAIQFLRTTENILREPDSLLAITPQSRFADVRERPVHFEAGLGHLAARAERAVFVAMAMELVFWEERLPEILVRFGEPVEIGTQPAETFGAKYWTAVFEKKLEAAQDALAVETQRRDPGDFEIVLRGSAGQGGVYDLWRGLKAKLRGEKFNREHGRK
jgi:1-acyl-sn-glycerol-3-phosphate acyltransferase